MLHLYFQAKCHKSTINALLSRGPTVTQRYTIYTPCSHCSVENLYLATSAFATLPEILLPILSLSQEQSTLLQQASPLLLAELVSEGVTDD